MKTLSIHNLDDHLLGLIDRQVRETGQSRNRVIKQLLAESLGVKPVPSGRRHDEFARFCGIWSAAQKKEFEKNTKDFEQVDPEDWR